MPTKQQLWEKRIAAAAEKTSAPELLDALLPLTDRLRGRDRQNVKHRALQRIESTLLAHPAKLVQLGQRLSETGQETGQELAVFLLSGQYAYAPEEVTSSLRTAVDSSYPDVRKWAFEACGTLLAKHFDSFRPRLAAWIADPSPNVRLAVVHAVHTACKIPGRAWGKSLLSLIEPLMKDKHPAVKQKISPFALGEGLMIRYPQDVVNRLAVWAASEHTTVRMHAALLFASPVMADHWETTSWALDKLSVDPVPAVRQAAERSWEKLEKQFWAQRGLTPLVLMQA